MGHKRIHPLFKWLWKTNCQMKHKGFFFWLLLKDGMDTRDILQRKGMQLDSFTCDLCILQRLETTIHPEKTQRFLCSGNNYTNGLEYLDYQE